MNIEDLRKEYESQDNRATAYPFFVSAQELVCIGVIADGCSACCPYGDGVTEIEFTHRDLEGTYESRGEAERDLLENYGYDDETQEMFDDIEELNMGYIWVDRQPFLTIKGAELFLKTNAHNMGKTRTYVKWFHRRNFEMRELLPELGFKSRC